MTQENRLEAVELELADIRREVVELKRRMDDESEVKRRPVAQKTRISYPRLTGGFR